MVALSLVFLWSMGVGVIVSGTTNGMELRKRKNVVNHDDSDNEEISESSKSVDSLFDETEASTRPKRKRREDAESDSNSRKSSDESGPHQCRFCKMNFKQSQALGGHMNRHRMEKDREALLKAESLLASNPQYAANIPWNMQGHPGYNYGGPGLLPNPQAGPGMGAFYNVPHQAAPGSLQNSHIMNHNLPNAHCQQLPMQQQPAGEGFYNPMDSTRTSHYSPMPAQMSNIMNPPPAQFQGPQGLPQVYSHSTRSVIHGQGTDMMQPPGQSSVFQNSNIHSSDTLLDMMNMPCPVPSDSFIRQAARERQINNIQFVDQHGNPVNDFQSGQSSEIVLQDEYQPHDMSLKVELGQQMMVHVPDASQGESSTLMEHGQACFDAESSVDVSGNLP